MSKIEKIVKAIKEKETLFLKTSGTSTGDKKDISVDLGSRYSSVRRLELEKTYTVGFLYDLDSWASVSTISFCVKNNINFVKITNYEQCFDASIHHLCMTPSQLLNISLINKQNLSVRQVTLGGEYATQNVIDKCKTIFPNARVTHVYAATEVGDICAVSDGLEGIPQHKFKDYQILEDKIIINGVELSDMWQLNDGRYYFLGRADHKVNVAGNLVNPVELEKIIQNLPGVENCVIYSKRVPIIGNALFLKYVGSIEKAELKSILQRKLNKFQIPFIKKGNLIETNSNGKKIRVFK